MRMTNFAQDIKLQPNRRSKLAFSSFISRFLTFKTLQNTSTGQSRMAASSIQPKMQTNWKTTIFSMVKMPSQGYVDTINIKLIAWIRLRDTSSSEDKHICLVYGL